MVVCAGQIVVHFLSAFGDAIQRSSSQRQNKRLCRKIGEGIQQHDERSICHPSFRRSRSRSASNEGHAEIRKRSLADRYIDSSCRFIQRNSRCGYIDIYKYRMSLGMHQSRIGYFIVPVLSRRSFICSWGKDVVQAGLQHPEPCRKVTSRALQPVIHEVWIIESHDIEGWYQGIICAIVGVLAIVAHRCRRRSHPLCHIEA